MQSRDVMLEGEHPDTVVADVVKRTRPKGRIIVVANEKGGVGKSTIAFHLCVGLLHAGHKVAAIDLDRRQQTLSRVLTARDGTVRRLGLSIDCPRHAVLNVHSAAMLCQEMMRIGPDCDAFVIDVPGYDSFMTRRAVALADMLVTPVNASFIDLDLLGRFHPVTHDLTETGCFAKAVSEIRDARQRAGIADLEWLVLENRWRRETSINQTRVESALRLAAREAGFRVSRGLGERVAYRDLFLLGLTHLDLKAIPALPAANPQATREIAALVDLVGPGSAAAEEVVSPCDLAVA